MVDITALVVLYKVKPRDSETIQSLMPLANKYGVRVVIWDNSPEQAEKCEIDVCAGIRDLHYTSCIRNEKLSVLYNKVIDQYKKDTNLFVLLDQDTALTDEYFINLLAAVKDNPDIGLFLPVVYSGTRLVSPGQFQHFKGRHLKKVTEGRQLSRSRLAITSGMAVRAKLISDGQLFDERLSLYGVDTKFMLDYAKTNDFFFVLSTTLQHNTALWSRPPLESMVYRVNNLHNAWAVILDVYPGWREIGYLYRAYVRLKLAISYRSFLFIFRISNK